MIHVEQLWNTATAVATTAVITSKPISMLNNRGFCSMLIILAGATPEVDIAWKCGMSDTGTFYAPIDGVGTDISAVYSALDATKWIQFDPVVAPWIQITITGTAGNGANTTVKAYLMWQEEIFPT